jgi:sn-1 stearoyl-lipid 9-desaturase
MTIATSAPPKYNWSNIIVHAILHATALLAFLPQFFSWQAVGVAFLLNWLTGALGITLGWHRLVAHRSFKTPKWLEYLLVFLGTLSLQRGPIWWIGLHRHHHVHSDRPTDHHDSRKGFWWSHMGWVYQDVPAEAELPRFTKDIADDPVYKFLDKYFFELQVLLAVALYLIGGWSFIVWGVCVRLVVTLHFTFFVNSATHRFGYRSHETDDYSTNCWWVALVTYGEGWHNNHHAFQYSARHGLKWWEIDLTWATIWILEKLGLASDVKLPSLAESTQS